MGNHDFLICRRGGGSWLLPHRWRGGFNEMKFATWQLGLGTQLGHTAFLPTPHPGLKSPSQLFPECSSKPQPSLPPPCSTHSRADQTQLAPQARRKPLASPVHGQIPRGLLGACPWSPGLGSRQQCFVQPRCSPRRGAPRRAGLGNDRTRELRRPS